MVESVTASLAAGIIVLVIGVMALARALKSRAGARIVHPDGWHAAKPARKPAPKSERDGTRSRRAG
jgi:hypothetical protein